MVLVCWTDLQTDHDSASFLEALSGDKRSLDQEFDGREGGDTAISEHESCGFGRIERGTDFAGVTLQKSF